MKSHYLRLCLIIALIFSLTSFTSFAQTTGSSSITLSSTSITVPQGGTSSSISYKVDLASGSTWGTQLVVSNMQTLQSEGITINGLPSGMEDPPFSGTFTVSVSSSAAAGSYSVVLAATGDDPSTSSVTLTVDVTAVAVPTLSISLAPNIASVVQGSSISTVVSVNISSGSVALSASGLPAGASATFSPSTLTASGSSTMSISTSSATPPGTYTISVTASGPQGVSKVASYTLTVTSIPTTQKQTTSPVYEYVAIVIAVIVILIAAYLAISRRAGNARQSVNP
ncbi:MAG: hypothetical protein QXQ39_02940 [Conexivisphaerales archaeon]